jgi:hypothetical protein
MNDKTELRRMARDAIGTGRMPRIRPLRTWAGMGDDSPCSLCAAPIHVEEVEIEMEFDGASRPEPVACRVHARCFEAWEIERASELLAR